jgi:plastocyanin
MVASLPWLATACSLTGGTTTNEHERTVLVDYHFDQFSAVFPAYFPKQVTVRQGDTIVFKQFWSGEPHSITTGTLVDEPFKAIWPILKLAPPFPAQQPDTPEVKAAIGKLQMLPSMYSQNGFAFAQNGAQPCYLDTGTPPGDENTPCPKRSKPAFNGNQAFYSSGILPYEGDQGNTFRLPIAADAGLGIHNFFCLLHGPLMSGSFTIVAKNASIPPQTDVNTQAQKEITRYTDPGGKAFTDAKAGKDSVKGNLAGAEADPTAFVEITEFVPRSIKAKVGEKVTWHIVGDAHTISFNVPKYLPEVKIAKDGTVSYPEQIYKPVGGPGFDNSSGPPPGSSEAPPPVAIDAGKYDGSTFLSSGLGGGGGGPGPPQDFSYSVTFTKAGTYKYACLVHPLMIGEVVVQ